MHEGLKIFLRTFINNQLSKGVELKETICILEKLADPFYNIFEMAVFRNCLDGVSTFLSGGSKHYGSGILSDRLC